MKTNNQQRIFNLLIILLMTLLIVAGISSFAISQDKDKDNYSQATVMTRNLYLGADIFKVVEAAQEVGTLPMVVAEVYNTMLFTNFRARAEAIADEIAEHEPGIIGLQEVSTFYKQTPGDFLQGNPMDATEVVIDFYEVLNNALLARGMEYEPFSVTNADVELPMVDLESATGLSDVRMVDRDMVLVRKGSAASEVLAENYSTNLALEIAGVKVEFTRGFLIVDVEIEGQGFRFVNTHLEVRGAEDSVFRIIQDKQMLELTGILNQYANLDPKPVIMVGDFNSSSEDVPGVGYHPFYDMWISYVPPYMQAVDAGYLDAWRLQKRNNEVYTSGFDEYVSDRTAELTSRIDLIFVDRDDFFNSVECVVVGNKVPDMIPNPIAPSFLRLWPSDHAGVVGKFILNN